MNEELTDREYMRKLVGSKVADLEAILYKFADVRRCTKDHAAKVLADGILDRWLFEWE